MCSIGKYYANAQQMEKSMEWYRKAAEAGLELVMKARKKWASPDIEYLDN